MKPEYPKLAYEKHTFLSSFVSGLSAIIITLIICITGIIIYGIHVTGEKSEEIISLAQNTLHNLPAIEESLPPLASDILNNKREPEYRDQIEITAKPVMRQQNGKLGASLTILNKGPKVVSLMSLRITVLDNKNEVLSEMNEWVVTPVANKDNWPGPLMPGSRRYFTAYGNKDLYIPNLNDLKTEVEITEIRIWNEEDSLQIKDVNEPASVL